MAANGVDPLVVDELQRGTGCASAVEASTTATARRVASLRADNVKAVLDMRALSAANTIGEVAVLAVAADGAVRRAAGELALHAANNLRARRAVATEEAIEALATRRVELARALRGAAAPVADVAVLADGVALTCACNSTLVILD